MFPITDTAISKVDVDVPCGQPSLMSVTKLGASGPRQQDEAIRLNFPFTCMGARAIR